MFWLYEVQVIKNQFIQPNFILLKFVIYQYNKIFDKVNCRLGSWKKPSLNRAEQPKDYGINTKANTQKPSFIPFPFGSEQRQLKHSVTLFFIIKSCVMSTISVSVHQRSTSFSIYLSASTTNGVVSLPITVQQFKSLFGTCIGCAIQPGQRTYYLQCLPF